MSDTPANPMVTAQRLARRELPRRFYGVAAAAPHEGGFAVLLDGRVAKTPGRRPLVVARRRVADALAAEWAGQHEHIDPAVMPLTRIVNAAIDRVAGAMAAVRAEVVAYAMRDLVCYRAQGPEALVVAQAAGWDPLIAWAGEALGARLILGRGVVPVTQHPGVAAAVEKTIARHDAFALAAVHSATTLTGSAVIALSLAAGRLTVDDAWAAAHVDEDWQMAQWGRDEVALAQRAARRRELDAASLILAG